MAQICNGQTCENNQNHVIMPFEYGENEHYYVESLGELPTMPVYSFVKRFFDSNRIKLLKEVTK